VLQFLRWLITVWLQDLKVVLNTAIQQWRDYSYTVTVNSVPLVIIILSQCWCRCYENVRLVVSGRYLQLFRYRSRSFRKMCDIITCISNIDVDSVSNGVIIFKVDWTSYANKVRLYSFTTFICSSYFSIYTKDQFALVFGKSCSHPKSAQRCWTGVRLLLLYM